MRSTTGMPRTVKQLAIAVLNARTSASRAALKSGSALRTGHES